MSRQAGSIVRGNSKPRRISVRAGRQQVRLCTADTAKGQGRRELAGKLTSELAGAAGLEPATTGFGDRYSPNRATPLGGPSVAADLGRFKHRPGPDCKGEAVNALFNPAFLRQT